MLTYMILIIHFLIIKRKIWREASFLDTIRNYRNFVIFFVSVELYKKSQKKIAFSCIL